MADVGPFATRITFVGGAMPGLQVREDRDNGDSAIRGESVVREPLY